ncbi:c-type cytochrome biogenesis protein CcmI [Tropicibacter naphthalenivorans]|uniref:Cytochrome c-type biogenesis protein CcmI n=1 Tax=Tropicibacter naphthalenivorans TaxID=441103 RepID=A0A0P1GEX0_9RHOB|nr:c-type cytochrome biogenesis protein CcmI [Tropicibacter naphthalenivorans]CUH80013.1 cytochrome c-type biogenesis protein CcmI [Tropicibacter naphthalenivorans]SMC83483.1 cytochrome c-type biogenesis protein CcmH [Tropicibacter naphthalenivorans]
MTFWIVTSLATLALTASLVMAVLRGRRETGPAEAFDLQVYRDQLSEIERDAASGKIPAEEAERLKVEISRRILSADAKLRAGAETGGQPRAAAVVMSALMALVLLGGGFGLYTWLGAPGYPDLPLQARKDAAEEARKSRPSQADAEARVPAQANPEVPAEYMDLVTKLREAVANRPDDLQGHVLLARSEAAIGNYKASYQAQARIVQLKGEDATAKDYADLADMMILAAGGFVSPEAQKVIEKTLSIDPRNEVARFYGGLMMAQTGRPDIGFRMWDELLRNSAPDAPWVQPIRQQIEEMAFRAGVSDYQLPAQTPPMLRGPSSDDVAAAAELTGEERMDMIRGMVGQLSERLATEGGTPQEWSRLISSLTVLGNMEQATEIWVEAQTVFANEPEALATIRSAAQNAGVAD